jgi:UBX domain
MVKPWLHSTCHCCVFFQRCTPGENILQRVKGVLRNAVTGRVYGRHGCRPKFAGKGNKLGAGASTSTAPPTAAQPIETWSGPDDSQPITSIQIRMPDGQRLVGRFNHTQLIREIRSFVAAARPGQPVPPTMMTGFPSKAIEDESVSIEAGGLVSSVVVFK